MIPMSRKEQIEAVAKFLDADFAETLTPEELAGRVVDGFHRLLTRGIKELSPQLHVGMAFRSPLALGTFHVAWIDGNRIWVVSETSKYGWLGSLDSPFWTSIEESPDRRRTKKKVKSLNDEGEEVTTEVEVKLGPRPGSPGNNPNWKAGDRVSRNQRMEHYRVIATGDKCVLLENERRGDVMVDSNENMSKHYRRES